MTSQETIERDADLEIDPAELEIDPAAIDADFVPQPRAEVIGAEVDGESVLLLEGTRKVRWSNATGTIIWKTFDGMSTIREIVSDISEVFGVPSDVVTNDVLAFVRDVGKAGLLEGVKEEQIRPDFASPPRLEVGAEAPPFELPDLEGSLVSLESLRGSELLLVNWRPGCGFCVQIAPALAEIEPALRARGVRLVLVALEGAEQNQALLQESGLDCLLLLQSDGVVELFAGWGTPAAYLLDADGKVASDFAVGANEVPLLAKRAAGIDEPAE